MELAAATNGLEEGETSDHDDGDGDATLSRANDNSAPKETKQPTTSSNSNNRDRASSSSHKKSRSRSRERPSSSSSDHAPVLKLFVAPLPADVTEAELRAALRLGDAPWLDVCQDWRTQRCKGFAFVYFDDQQHYAACLALDRQVSLQVGLPPMTRTDHPWQGVTLDVQPASSREKCRVFIQSAPCLFVVGSFCAWLATVAPRTRHRSRRSGNCLPPTAPTPCARWPSNRVG